MTGVANRENVTLSLPADVLRKARHLAVDRGVSLSRYLSQVLEEQVSNHEEYQRAKERWRQRVREARSLGSEGRIGWTRDELHER
jgi:hypothetical protein